MQKAINTTTWVVRLTGMTQVVLGVLFWTGHGLSLIPVHMAIGLTFVLALWVLAALAVKADARGSLIVLVAIWGAVVLTLGMTQTRLLPGHLHWLIQVLHLLVGVAAMGLAATLAQQTQRRPFAAGTRVAPPPSAFGPARSSGR